MLYSIIFVANLDVGGYAKTRQNLREGTMEEDLHYYSDEQIEVSYDVNRCIHTRECVNRLPEVFDPDKRPWIDPDNADVDDLADVIMSCPTGALQFERT